MNSAIHHMAGAQMQADAIRDSLRNPRLPNEPKPARSERSRRLGFALLYRLRPATV
jgi:hypothetical protein